MSSGKVGGKPLNSGTVDSSTKGKDISEAAIPRVDQLTHGVAEINLNSPTQNADVWEVAAKKLKNKASKPWGSQPQPQNYNLKPQGSHPSVDSRRSGGRGGGRIQSSNRAFENAYKGPPAPAVQIPPPLEHGWNWRSSAMATDGPAKYENSITTTPPVEFSESESDDDIDASDDELHSDEFDSDCSQKSHETLKKSRWFKAFFEVLDGLTIEEINSPERKWHCPACQNGPCAIQWFKGLQALLTHAITKRTIRVNVHRELAELLDEEMKRRGTNIVPAGETFGKWRGLEYVKDREIVWPPMVIIMNTQLEKDEKDDKWKGMGTQELLEYFSGYDAKKAKHSYGPQGHRGMSILIFDATAVGYLEAERLSKHFEDKGTDREAWDSHRVLFLPGGQRQLYGYMAEKEDLEFFNRHCPGKTKLKYDMRSYHGVVVSKLKQMSEENQQLVWFKNKIAKEQRHSKALEETCTLMSEQLRKTTSENRIVRQKIMTQTEENKEEMDQQVQFYAKQMEIIRIAREAKEDNFEKIQQEERLKVKVANPSREEEVKKFIEMQDREMTEFVTERERMEKMQGEKRAAMKKKHLEEELQLEKEFDAEFTLLMERYTPTTSNAP